MFGSPTFGIAMKLLKWLPIKLVDRFLLLVARMVLGDTEKQGLKRPKLGPLEIKNVTGKSPVLDVGAWSLIKSGNIKVRRGCQTSNDLFVPFRMPCQRHLSLLSVPQHSHLLVCERGDSFLQFYLPRRLAYYWISPLCLVQCRHFCTLAVLTFMPLTLCVFA
jgi:hypothetical protein